MSDRDRAPVGTVRRALTATATVAAVLSPLLLAGSVPAARGTFLSSFAILAHDAATGQIGVAVASRSFSAGSGVPAVAPQVGAVVVQGMIDGSASRRALEAIRSGGDAEAAIAAALASVPGRPIQVGALTAGCDVATHSGADDFPPVQIRSGDVGDACYLAIGSLLGSPQVAAIMAARFEATSGPLAARLMEALAAGEGAGGEIPPSRSALLWVATPEAASGAFGRAELRLQVDNQPDAVEVLRQLVGQAEADNLARQAGDLVDDGEYAEAAELASQATRLDPESALAWMNRGRALLFDGQVDEAERSFRRMLELNPLLLGALGDPETGASRPGVIPFDPRLLQRLETYRKVFFPDATFSD